MPIPCLPRALRGASPAALPLALSLTFALPLALPLPVLAQSEAARPADIAPGPLGPALTRYAAASGVLLSFDPALVQGRTTGGLRGTHTPRAGLERLLAGSGLALRAARDGGYTIEPAAAPGVSTLTPLTITGVNQESAWGPVNGRVARRAATGTKTDTPLIETPQSITVVGREFIEDSHAQKIGEVLRYTAGVITQEGVDRTTDAFIVRGFQLVGYGSTYRDGMKYMGNVYDGTQEPYGLERVEVLRGASSVLYGQSSPGGIINAVSKLPTDEPLHEIRAELGNFDRRQIATDHGGRLDEAGKWTYRLTALARDSDTMVQHVPDDRVFLAPSLRWRPSAATSLTLLGTYQRSKTAYIYGLPMVGTLQDNPNGRIPTRRFLGEPGEDSATMTFKDIGYRLEHSFNDTLTLRQNLRYFEARNDMPSASTGAWLGADQRLIARGFQDRVDESSNFVVDTQLQARLRQGELAHTVLLGVDYSDRSHRSERYNRTLAPLDVYAPVYGATPGPRVAALNSSDNDSRRMGVYLQDQMKWRDKWVLLLGGRYDWARNTTRALFLPREATERDEAFTGRAGLVYLADNGLAPFVSYSQSFEPQSGTDRQGASFDPTEGEQYEIGIRYQPANSQMLLSAALFQLTQSKVLTPDPVAPTMFQVQTGEIRSRGLELEASVPVADDLRLMAAYAYTDARITRSNNPAEVDTRRGATPRHQASLWADYRFTRLGLPQLRAGAGVRYVGTTKGLFNTNARVPAYTIADAMMSYEAGRWTYTLNVNNIADKDYVASYTYGAFYGQRRTVVAGATYRW